MTTIHLVTGSPGPAISIRCHDDTTAQQPIDVIVDKLPPGPWRRISSSARTITYLRLPRLTTP